MSRSLRPSPIRRGIRRAASALVLTGALALTAACGGDMDTDVADAPAPSAQEPTPSAAPGSADPAEPAEPAEPDTAVTTITAVEDDFSISVDEQELSAGSYEIEVVNEGGASHDLVVERDGEDVAATEIMAPGESATLAVDLEPGTYVFYCSVGTHRAMGMEITVEVAA